MEEDKGGNHDNSGKEGGNDCETGDGVNSERETEGTEEKEKDSSSSEDKEGNGNSDEMSEEREENEAELAKENKEPDLFTLSAVNAYGSQEVRKIEDTPDKIYTVSSKCLYGAYNVAHLTQHLPTDSTYIGCNWESAVKEACYNSEIAEVSTAYSTPHTLSLLS